MEDNSVFLTVRLKKDGEIHSVEYADGTCLYESTQNLKETPKDLGSNKLGKILDFHLIKVISPDGRYSWALHRYDCSWFQSPEASWIAPDQ